tara:strand:- start:150 stop:764 length:615 start_codon:yes stop_codon:yes gene_type:complete
MYCLVSGDRITAYINEGSPFTLGDIQYPSDWLAKCAPDWPAANGLLTLVITGDQTQDPFHQTEYADSVINGVPTRTYTRTLKTQAACQSFLYGAVGTLRWQKETGPFTVSGITLTLDETTKSNLSGAIQLMDKDPSLTSISWKVGPNTFVTLDKATLTALGVAVGVYTQQLFAANKTHCDAIAALTAAQCATYDYTTGWPSNGA